MPTPASPAVLDDVLARVRAVFRPPPREVAPPTPASLDTIAELLTVLVAEVRALRRDVEL